MKRLLALIALFIAASSSQADTYVNGYIKKDGTYVPPYIRTSPDSTNWNNYSTQGNYNPYTGADGTRARDYSWDSQNYGGGKPIYTGPRGGQYYYNDAGRKVYVPKN